MALKPPKAAVPAKKIQADTGMGADDGKQGTDDEEDEPGDDAEGGEEGEGQEQGEVIATILKNSDGTYTLIHGDEDEAEDKGEEGEEDEGEEGEGDEPKQEHFDSEGALLKGVLDCVRADAGGEYGSADQDFEGGFNEEKAPEPAAATTGARARDEF